MVLICLVVFARLHVCTLILITFIVQHCVISNWNTFRTKQAQCLQGNFNSRSKWKVKKKSHAVTLLCRPRYTFLEPGKENARGHSAVCARSLLGTRPRKMRMRIAHSSFCGRMELSINLILNILALSVCLSTNLTQTEYFLWFCVSR